MFVLCMFGCNLRNYTGILVAQDKTLLDFIKFSLLNFKKSFSDFHIAFKLCIVFIFILSIDNEEATQINPSKS